MSCKLKIYEITMRDLICAYVKIDYRVSKPLCHRLALARASILVIDVLDNVSMTKHSIVAYLWENL